ncbi:MAG: PTS maltose transporter subunit IIBC, partial [Tetragenococcus koreensis]|nr:PTS maltose transporter subunit IIBC [Tetragenococcus koreensis]
VASFNIGVGGLPGILSIIPEYWIGFLISMAIAIIVPLALVIFFEKKGILTKWENDNLPIPKLGS